MARVGVGDAPRGLEWLLMASVVLYALQASYSADFSKALENMVFFYVPFALLFALLREVRWTRELLLVCLGRRWRWRCCSRASASWSTTASNCS